MPYFLVIIIAVLFLVYIFYDVHNKENFNPIEQLPQINVDSDMAKCIFNMTNNSSVKIGYYREKLNRSIERSYFKILKAYEYIDRDARNKKEMIPAGEWLLDNLYLIEKEYKNIKHNMPYGDCRKLPVIQKGILKGYPRIYEIALKIVYFADGKIDKQIIEKFVSTYQNSTVLTMSELWVLPVMLRIALIQNISRITDNVIFSQREKEKAEKAAEYIIDDVHYNKGFENVKRLLTYKKNFTPYFSEKLIKVLRDNGIDQPEIYGWIERRLEFQDSNSEKMINIEHQKQVSFQLTIGNCIKGIREIEILNWRESFEKLSAVESVLREDPCCIYDKMEFESKNYYRRIVQKIASSTHLAESFVAKKAVECAQEAVIKNEDEEYLRHVGYYLIDDGINCLKKKISFRHKFIHKPYVISKKYKKILYIGTIILGTLALMSAVFYLSIRNTGFTYFWGYLIAALVTLVPFSEIVISILNWSINHLSEPQIIPKLEFKNGIPEKYSTIVVIPTILNSEKSVHKLCSSIEVYYLANMEKNLYFAILSDFKDSKFKEEENDKAIVNAALNDIKKLNQKYSKCGNIFYFFSRYRKYNKKENIWMGWERKRGKLVEFNRLIRGDKNTSYDVISSDIEKLKKVKYVITLDTDTKLPRDTAKKLIGTMAHVLNTPHIDYKNKKVVRGYGIMQPRISISNVSANKTEYSSIFSGETGIDVYTCAVSDVYQDVFKEGIYTGKGIYDVDVFNYILDGEIPENAVLSHDLIEGIYLRCALLSDVELIDDYPSYYNSGSRRLHRWVRGDWQLIPWIFSNKHIDAISKWKMIDNLRRSLLSPSIMILLALSFNVLPNGTDKWVTTALLAIVCPILFDVSENVIEPIKGISLSGRIDNCKTVIKQVFIIYCFMAYQAYLMLDAIIRTLYRLFISKRKLLEWETAEYTEKKLGNSLKSFLSGMWQGSAISLFILIIAFNKSLSAGFLMMPSCILWLLSPFIAFYISRDNINKDDYSFDQKDKLFLRRISRKTWAYFEDFIGDFTDWLPPDNFQEIPKKSVAMRTSPTNIGMGIITNICAYDMGYIDIYEFIERTEKMLENIQKLKSYKGHLFNWYNIKTKEPIKPMYISSVDSGNFISYLWVSAQSCNDYKNKSILSIDKYDGLIDVLLLGNEEALKYLKYNNFYDDIIMKIEKCSKSITSINEILREMISKSSYVLKNGRYEEMYWNKKVMDTALKFLSELKRIIPFIDKIDKVDKSIIEKMNNICFNTKMKDAVLKEENLLKEISDEYVISCVKSSINEINNIIISLDNIISKFESISRNTDFSILYDKERQLFSIAYDYEKKSFINCYYDLLASESRQASFIAIAKGDVEVKHWFKLGRSMTVIGKNKGLVSWSGTMFEYLMPVLIMKSYKNTLLSETYYSVVEGQKEYGKKKKIPWGISESAFYEFDRNFNYQYKAFGIPGIGLKRGLEEETVISPYSTVMALLVDKECAFKNMIRLSNEGFEGRYGYYEAADYTRSRLPKGSQKEVIKCFMVHHEGMSLMALDDALYDNILQERFHEIPRVKATDLLLQERVPKTIIYDREPKINSESMGRYKYSIVARKYNTAYTKVPVVCLLSNGSYSVMVSNSGSGYSKKDNTMLYRWREDTVLDNKGFYIYIKDIKNHKYWSSTFAPCMNEGEKYKASFSLDKAEFERFDEDIETHTEICVSNEDNAEVRRVSFFNHSDTDKILEITSYSEITISELGEDAAHPAFYNLFISTEFVAHPECIIAKRNARSSSKKDQYVVETVTVEGETLGEVQYETSRLNFIGRNRNLSNPYAVENDAPLKNSTGAVIDPVLSLRKIVKIKSGSKCSVSFIMAYADSREEAVKEASKYSERNIIKRTFEIARTKAQFELKYMSIKPLQANLYQVLASKILFLNSSLKGKEKDIKKGQKDLWKYGISGDLKIVLLIVKKQSDINIVKQLLSAHKYLRMKGLNFDLVIMNNEENEYHKPLQNSIKEVLQLDSERESVSKNGGVFLFNKFNIEKDDINFIYQVARFVIDSSKGFISSQINEDINSISKRLGEDKLKKTAHDYTEKPFEYKKRKLLYFNDIGGFDEDNNEYVIDIKDYENTPAPWINVISNGKFGFTISENGTGYTWNKNSRENKITDWSNDWVTDYLCEGIYIEDESSGEMWGVSPKPARSNGEYIISHGFGYSRFEHYQNGIIGTMTVFVPMNENVKMYIINLKNNTNKSRNISVYYYGEIVMGALRYQNMQYISTYLNKDDEYLYAENPYNRDFKDEIAYIKIFGGFNESFTGSREEFIGRGGDTERPDALCKNNLSNITGSGMDPCLCEKVHVNLEPDEEKNLIVLLGEDDSFDKIDGVLEKYGNIDNALAELKNVESYWSDLLSTIRIKTPDLSMNLIANGYLLYQVLSCRILSRTAFYQCGGAFGFRDQLQDMLPMLYVKPEIVRKHILYSASRQFEEGDVEHWWHPYVESGIKTRISDDLLWLPYVISEYIKFTGDYSILDEKVSYLASSNLNEDETERYEIFKNSGSEGTIYDHCIRAIKKSLKFGPHNIPLIGTGDWNDGMNMIGVKGKGESVWLGWFLYSVLDRFKDICIYEKDKKREEKCSIMCKFIKDNIEKNAWDGSWYKRAYFDNGKPLGSIENDECKIDSISQSWSILSGAGDAVRQKEAMNSLLKYLVKSDKGIVMLLSPPFDKTKMEPGYIKGYIPGVRENGGQYTHSVIWVIKALVEIGEYDKALRIFDMINPVNHTKSYFECQVYKVEPYVMTGDVYAKDPNVGRGGWTWYTGSAGWMYSVCIGSILGFKIVDGKGFTIKPGVPESWNEFEMNYKRGNSIYSISVKRSNDKGIFIDGKCCKDNIVPFLTHGKHNVEVFF